MTKNLTIVVCFTAFLACGAFAQPTKNDQESVFKQAKQGFEAFEREHGHFIQTPNVRMHYLTWGDSADVPLIWLPGSFSNGYELRNVADALTEAGYYLIAVDYYGHGQTPVPQQEVSLYHIADDVKYLMDAMSIDRAMIGGWSRGGYISTAFYDTYPENTLGLILEDGGSVATNYNYHRLEPDSLTQLIASFEVEKYVQTDTAFASKQAAFFSLYDKDDTTNQFHLLSYIKEVAPDKWAVNPGLFQLFHHSSSEQIANNILRPASVPLFAASMTLIEPRIIFRNLDVPVLILDATHADDLFPFEAANRALQANHPTLINHIVFEDTGHNIHSERPEQFIQHLSNFLNEVR
ncbi:alpha/beta fold hydrolase [Tunicatimonas pelagia]|uniref:alpha/beta fold hydrolase n=1 Tax=Tunicatimonas pelagia TaxID=931531 RepID=UPI002666A1B4|nr:alpha/beta hydrolase [Tunicatimonas pelagia]WKN41547.1 alpha/beta hydrolase [Tunicatimonas pelagia]